jgi:hypothetical protein
MRSRLNLPTRWSGLFHAGLPHEAQRLGSLSACQTWPQRSQVQRQRVTVLHPLLHNGQPRIESRGECFIGPGPRLDAHSPLAELFQECSFNLLDALQQFILHYLQFIVCHVFSFTETILRAYAAQCKNKMHNTANMNVVFARTSHPFRYRYRAVL